MDIIELNPENQPFNPRRVISADVRIMRNQAKQIGYDEKNRKQVKNVKERSCDPYSYASRGESLKGKYYDGE